MKLFVKVRGVNGHFVPDPRSRAMVGAPPRGIGKKPKAGERKHVGALDDLYDETEQIIDVTGHDMRKYLAKAINSGALVLMGKVKTLDADTAAKYFDRKAEKK